MHINHITSYSSFCEELLSAGFSMGGSNSEGVFSLSSKFDENIAWHTENPETDPWEWRMRVLNERNDIAYAKLFFSKSGYITKKWYPYFLKARRNGLCFEDEYQDGTISQYAKRIYELLEQNEALPLHLIKQLGGFSKEDKAKFDKAITELQMKMYITMCGSRRKISKIGDEYGWSSTVFCTTEAFWGDSVFKKAEKLSQPECILKITEQIYKMNPEAESKKIKKFIRGM